MCHIDDRVDELSDNCSVFAGHLDRGSRMVLDDSVGAAVDLDAYDGSNHYMQNGAINLFWVFEALTVGMRHAITEIGLACLR